MIYVILLCRIGGLSTIHCMPVLFKQSIYLYKVVNMPSAQYVFYRIVLKLLCSATLL